MNQGITNILKSFNYQIRDVKTRMVDKANLKTINGISLEGAGNIEITGTSSSSSNKIDGGTAASIYLVTQNLNGGAA